MGVGAYHGSHLALAPGFLVGAGKAVGGKILVKGFGIVGSGKGDGGDGLLATGERGCGLIISHFKCGGECFGCGFAYGVIVVGEYRFGCFQGQLLEINGKEVWTRLVGRFNGYNLTAIYGAAVLSGIEEGEALRLLSMLEAAEGRFEYVEGRGITAIVDYAHTPDALENVLGTVNAIRREGQRLLTVVGCGGDRDKSKRPEMAQIGMKMSDVLILTSDNPRTEDPEAILDDMEAGLDEEQKRRALRISDRREAIKTACRMAKEGDIVMVAGKGHEKYQDVNGVKHHFDDKEELAKELV